MTPDTFTIQADSEAAIDDNQPHEHESLRYCTEYALKHFFECLDGQMTTGLYDLVISEVEQPLLETVMAYTRNNQSKAAQILGLNRGTLRKKLKQYDLL
ncbi:DNA-binding transcriptional regulator Fis [bacterium SCSIO 12696]|nr:DNA-binding transcriptional regulator Fis [bacterium SCSIO 12696]